MPKVLHDLAMKIKSAGKGMPESKAWAIATSALQRQGKLPKKKDGKK